MSGGSWTSMLWPLPVCITVISRWERFVRDNFSADMEKMKVSVRIAVISLLTFVFLYSVIR